MKTMLALLSVLAATGVQAAPIPDAVAAMLDAAAGDPAQLKTVADIAKKTNPGSAAEIDGKVAAITKAQADAHAEKLAKQSFTEGWSGSGEAGAYTSSGNTSNTGVAVGLGLAKESTHWKHSLAARVDYQRDSGVTSKERYFAGYEGNYKITPRFYALVTLSYEKDRFSGFDRRFSESLGLGYKFIDSEKFKLSGEAGPALRQTSYIDGTSVNGFAGRAAGDFWWQIVDGIAFTEDATVFYDSNNTSFLSLTALTAKLTGKLSARASFQLNTESNPPFGRLKSDKTSRVTLVYSF